MGTVNKYGGPKEMSDMYNDFNFVYCYICVAILEEYKNETCGNSSCSLIWKPKMYPPVEVMVESCIDQVILSEGTVAIILIFH